METPVKEPRLGYESRHPADGLEFVPAADKTAYWFAAAALFAFFAAGVIVYRSADPEFRIASADTQVAAPATNPREVAPPAYVHVEGVDP